MSSFYQCVRFSFTSSASSVFECSSSIRCSELFTRRPFSSSAISTSGSPIFRSNIPGVSSPLVALSLGGVDVKINTKNARRFFVSSSQCSRRSFFVCPSHTLMQAAASFSSDDKYDAISGDLKPSDIYVPLDKIDVSFSRSSG